MRWRDAVVVGLAWLVSFQVSGQESLAQSEGPVALDTLRMPSAVVEVFRIPTPVQRTPGALVVLDADQLQNGASPDIEDALNAIPGVKMETRGVGGSRRIQMRSSGLRSPFAVRNLHMLCDGFVLTGAGGASPIELWNPQWLHRLEVLLGPTGAIFGGGYGGALVATSLATFDGLNTGLSFQSLNRISTTGSPLNEPSRVAIESGFSVTGKKTTSDWTLQSTWSENPGYRDQEGNAKKNLEFHRRWKPQPNVLHHVWSGLFQASWDLPGSITSEQADAAPANAPGSAFDARVDRERYWMAWSRTATHGQVKNGLWAFGQSSNKYNPFGTSPFYQGLKEEQEINGSVRWWRGETRALNSNMTLTWDQSAIGRFERVQIDENDLLEPGINPRYAIESTSQAAWVGSGVRLEVTNAWLLDVQGGLEWVTRNTSGLFDQEEPIMAAYEESYNQLNWAPRIGIGYTFASNQHIAFQYAEGSSHPNTFELVDPKTNTFADLDPEHAQTWELSWKGSKIAPNLSFSWAFNAYHQTILDAIATVEGENDGLYIANVEGLQMKGLEGSLRTQVILAPGKSLEWEMHGNLNRHQFGFIMEPLPGTPLHAAGASLIYRDRTIQLQWNQLWNDRTALNDQATAWAPAYQRSDLAVSWSNDQSLWRIGIRNAFDAHYSNWLQINAFGGKHFNPAPGRTVWASWIWRITR